MTEIRTDLNAPGGLCFAEWALAGHGKKLQPRIVNAIKRSIRRFDDETRHCKRVFGRWNETDWLMLIESFRAEGLHVRNPLTRDAIREAAGEWMTYRARIGLIPDGFEALVDYTYV